jgi:hypothetical protein
MPHPENTLQSSIIGPLSPSPFLHKEKGEKKLHVLELLAYDVNFIRSNMFEYR